MISPSYDFEVFYKAVRNKDYLDTIYSAEQEATEAERFYYRHRKTNDIMIQECKQYVDALKGLISYLRYATKPNGTSDEHISLFHSVDERLDIRKRFSLPSTKPFYAIS